MIFKCKICGGELNIERGQSIVECEYCGVKQTLPRFFDENVKLMYDRANNYLLHNEFDKAENIYNQILYIDKEDADAYWSLVLCKYGITYVKDPKTGKYIPTCNRTYYSSIFDDENYKNAIKYANEEKKALFEADAKTIDDIQHSIIAISRKEKPFDIFISYKETGANGGRTKDSIAAQDLYEKLTNEGYKVFFSRITLEDKIGTEYEPYIYAVLASSKVMITICSSRENIEAVWVKNEWSRFFAFAQKDRTKTILPLYFDMDNTDLPDEFAHLPSYDMKSEGFEQDLIRGIKKLIPLPIMEKERREKRKKFIKKAGIGAAVCLVVAAICMIPWFMNLPDYNAAMQLYYDKNYPEATWAFDELGSYRNSKTMKDKCEKSWRNSLATVALTTVADDTGFYSGSYYINPNGAVETFQSDSGTFNEDIEIDENGKVVSVSYNEPRLYALYENGFVANAIENNSVQDKAEWCNIVKISSKFRSTNIALKADGTMTFGNVVNQYDNTFNDDWLEGIAKWTNIIDFGYCKTNYGYDCAIVGIRSDGTITAVTSDMFYPFETDLKKFNDVKVVDVQIGNSTEKDPVTGYYSDKKYLNIIALTNHDTIITYTKGVFEEFDSFGIIDLANFYYVGNTIADIPFLYEDGTVRMKDGKIVMLEDVVYLDSNYAVMRNGSLYTYEATQYDEILNKWEFEYIHRPQKVIVYDEWKERLD